MHNENSHQSQQFGFTLLELLVVVTLLGLLSLTAVAIIDNAGDQDRFENTRSRLATIRNAIIGDTSRTLNGEPMLSGYVADMGRLPSNIKELMELGSQTAWGEWDIEEFELGVSPTGKAGILYAGWRGPYLNGTPESSGTAFRDGWGTATSTTQPNNDGWNVTLTDATATEVFTGISATAIAVQSYGLDGVPSTSASGTYAADYPEDSSNLIEQNNWQLATSIVNFDVKFNGTIAPVSPSHKLKLVIYYFKDTNLDFEQSSEFDFGSPATGVNIQNVGVSVTEASLPMGKYAAVIWCTDPTSPYDPISIYDGNCDSTYNKQPAYFTVLPGISPHLTITWNIP